MQGIGFLQRQLSKEFASDCNNSSSCPHARNVAKNARILFKQTETDFRADDRVLSTTVEQSTQTLHRYLFIRDTHVINFLHILPAFHDYTFFNLSQSTYLYICCQYSLRKWLFVRILTDFHSSRKCTFPFRFAYSI